jgi:hypothetical protein
MPSLAETQALVRAAVVGGDLDAVTPFLVGGLDVQKRLAIHERHYESSLVTALLGKFPATAWLVGTPFVEQHARVYVRERPPHAPCIAEYGCDFPEFLSKQPGTANVPYLRAFGELEWAIGAASIAVERPALEIDRLAAVDTTALPDIVLALQAGLRYLRADWPVDELMQLYLADTAPEQLVLEPSETWIQVRGARGAFQIDRLSRGDFLFRQMIAEGRPIGDAATQALELGGNFDPGQALAVLFAERLVTAVTLLRRGEPK